MYTGIANTENCSLSNKYYFKKNITPKVEVKKDFSKSQKFGMAVSSAVGVMATTAILAKTHHYPLSIKKIFKTPLKERFLAKLDYGVPEVLTLGAGSCIGGLLGGLLFDKNKNNRQAKVRESLIQYTNISLPIITVGACSHVGKFLSKKLPKSLTTTKTKGLQLLGKTPEIIMPLVGLFAGIYIGNRASNKLNQKIFKTKEDRPVKVSDMSVHIDDLCVSSQYIAPNSIITKGISRIIPLALMFPGYEIAKKQEIDTKK